MMTHRERILRVIAGEMVDKIPYVPRIDLWYNANERAGTLPTRHKNRTVDEIACAEGWALHKIVPDFLKPETPEDVIHQGLGLVTLKEFSYDFFFSPDIEIKVERSNDQTNVSYQTPIGSVSVMHCYTEEMRKAGASVPWIQEHAIKGPEDYKILAYIFANMRFEPAYDRFARWEAQIGDNGLAFENSMALNAGSPMHFIQKVLIDATEFFLHYNDYEKEMAELVEALGHCYDQLIPILAKSPAQAVYWDANVDSMITYPEYLKKDILPWWQKAADVFHRADKLMLIHPDGENNRLMDILADCGADVCEAVTPYPMTKVRIEEYYDTWCRTEKLTLWGGIPESLLLEKSTTDEEFESYLDHLFKAVAPGTRFIAGIGDTTPPGAVFERLVRLGERIEKEGRLPLTAGGAVLLSADQVSPPGHLNKDEPKAPAPRSANSEAAAPLDHFLLTIQQAVLNGDNKTIQTHIKHGLNSGHSPEDILNRGMLSAMEIIGGRFKDGTVFIPEVLLSARALNEALTFMEPLLSRENMSQKGRILIGTVHGDLHDIGKNMVSTMLKGVGFEIIDLGINVPTEDFIEQVKFHQPDILALSALLTTTMPHMKSIIEGLQEAQLRSSIKVIVGGAPVNEKFARDIGADGYAHDAGEAVELAHALL